MVDQVCVEASTSLANKPLVEAILEIRWKMSSPAPGVQIDPHYKFLLGRFYDRVIEDYPSNEVLPQAGLPEEVVAHIVQHRFRVSENGWPLVQIGPGVMTVNDTEKYEWPDFRERCLAAVKYLYDAYPDAGQLRVENVMLRYIDAIRMDEVPNDVFDFLRDKMRVEIKLPEGLFAGTDVAPIPRGFNWQASFSAQRPRGEVHLRFATGQRAGEPALILETMVQSAGNEVPMLPDRFEQWVDAAHRITHAWFFKLIEGDLERRFRSDQL